MVSIYIYIYSIIRESGGGNPSLQEGEGGALPIPHIPHLKPLMNPDGKPGEKAVPILTPSPALQMCPSRGRRVL